MNVRGYVPDWIKVNGRVKELYGTVEVLTLNDTLFRSTRLPIDTVNVCEALYLLSSGNAVNINI